MCGRARCTLRADDIPRACHHNGCPVRTFDMDWFRPSYNVPPGSNLPVFRRDDEAGGEGYAVHCMKWGLVPGFTKKTEKPDFYKMFNARSESVHEKASFRRLLSKRRCVVAVEGFYEWTKDGSKKQPFYVHFKDYRPLVFAALYDSWRNSEDEMLYTFTILTTSSSSALQWLHDRMPVILGKGGTQIWLNGSPSQFDTVLKPYEDSDLVWYPVTPAIGKPSFNGPECIKEVPSKVSGTIAKFFLRKEIKEQSNPEERNTNHPLVKIDLTESVKMELGSEVLPGHHPDDHLGTEDKNDALMLFSRKDIKEQELNPEGKSLHEQSVVLDQPKILEEEHENEDMLEISSFPKMADHDSKWSVSTPTPEAQTKCKTKRDNEELSALSKLNMDASGKLRSNPSRKRANLKSDDDKQPTLLVYFGKK